MIADAEAAVGFRLAGVEAAVARDAGEAERLLRECLAEGCASLVLVKQGFLEAFSDATRRRIERLSVPLVIPVPLPGAWGKETPSRDYILGLIRRSIGYQMRITRG